MKNTFFYFLILLILESLAVQISKEVEESLPVFQPFPSLTLNPLLVCREGLTSSIVPFSINSQNYIALSLTLCGVFIYDISDFSNPILTYQDKLNSNGKTLGLISTHEQKYLWASHSTGSFYGIDISKIPFKIIVTSNSNKNLLIYKILPWPNNPDILFLFCNQQFQIFDWRDKTEPIRYLQAVNVNAVSSKYIQFVRKNEYALVIVPNKGIQFYQISNGDDIDNINFTYSCVLKPYFFDVFDFALLDDNTIAVSMLYSGIYIYGMKSYFDNFGNSCTSTTFNYISQTPFQGMGGKIQLSKDKKFLYSQFRVIGIRIYDITQRTFQVVQEIKVDKSCKDLILSDKEDLIYYSNSLTLQVFKRTTANFNRDIPNLLLNSYQMTQYTWFKQQSTGSIDYQCIWKENQKQLFLARANFGVTLLQYSGHGILESIRKQNTSKQFNMKMIVDNIKHGMELSDNTTRLMHLEVSQGQLNPLKQEENERSKALELFDEQGLINKIVILKFIQNEQLMLPEQKRAAKEIDLKKLENPTSILSQGILGLLAEHLLNIDRVSKSIFDFMNKKALRYYREIDWYRAYVNIKPQFEEIHSNPYPLITNDISTTKAALAEIFKSLRRYFSDPLTKIQKPIYFSFNLIQENLKAKAIGFSKIPPGFLQVSQGESIHAFSHTINSLKAFEKNNDIPCCLSLYQKLDLHYQEKGLTDNERLPSWIHSIDLINGAIMMTGIPEKKDIGNFFFKVIDQDKYILRSYEIQILQKLTEEPLNIKRSENKMVESSVQNFNSSVFEKNMLKSQKVSTFARKNENNNQDALQSSNICLVMDNQHSLSQSQRANNESDQQNMSNIIVDSFIKPQQIYQDKPQSKPSQMDDTFNEDNGEKNRNNYSFDKEIPVGDLTQDFQQKYQHIQQIVKQQESNICFNN